MSAVRPPATGNRHGIIVVTDQTVLVVGATGMLGRRIAAHLLDEPRTAVRMMVRDASAAAATTPEFLELRDRGAVIIEGDLGVHGSLDRATAGVDVIISAVQGGRETIVDGQLALLKSATVNRVRRMLPSDFALDLFRSPPGEHANFDMRREADVAIAVSGIEHVHVLNGAFMDNFLHSQFGGVFDMARGTASYWGDGHDAFDATSVEDTARYTARAALDRGLPNGKFAIASEQLTFLAMIDGVETVSGRKFERSSKGSIADLEATIAAQRAADPGSMEALGNTYLLYMLKGTTALTNRQNDRYPDIVAETYLQHVARTWEPGR
jgi:uncharacterized protein YbjT (DUF2867 family)